MPVCFEENETFGGLKKIISILGYNGAIYELNRIIKEYPATVFISANSLSEMFMWNATPQKFMFWLKINQGYVPYGVNPEKYPSAQGKKVFWRSNGR